MGEIVSAYKVVMRMTGINICKALRIVPHSMTQILLLHCFSAFWLSECTMLQNKTTAVY